MTTYKEELNDIEDLDTEFSNIIREKLSDRQFWNWVKTWFDADEVCDIAEGWETEEKEFQVKMLNKILKKGKK